MSPRPVKNFAPLPSITPGPSIRMFSALAAEIITTLPLPGGIVTRSVVLDLWATKQTSFGGELQRDVALEFNGAGNEIAGRNQNSPAASVRAGVDRFLDGDRVNGRSITDSPKVNNI